MAALIAVVLSAILQGNANPLALVIGGALPFLAALGGAWLGERAQGTI